MAQLNFDKEDILKFRDQIEKCFEDLYNDLGDENTKGTPFHGEILTLSKVSMDNNIDKLMVVLKNLKSYKPIKSLKQPKR